MARVHTTKSAKVARRRDADQGRQPPNAAVNSTKSSIRKVNPKSSRNEAKPDTGAESESESFKQIVYGLGGDEEDLKLLEGVDSGAEILENNVEIGRAHV